MGGVLSLKYSRTITRHRSSEYLLTQIAASASINRFLD
jgi:hypothetical protein